MEFEKNGSVKFICSNMYECKLKTTINEKVNAKCLGENLISVYLRQKKTTFKQLNIYDYLTRHWSSIQIERQLQVTHTHTANNWEKNKNK